LVTVSRTKRNQTTRKSLRRRIFREMLRKG